MKMSRIWRPTSSSDGFSTILPSRDFDPTAFGMQKHAFRELRGWGGGQRRKQACDPQRRRNSTAYCVTCRDFVGCEHRRVSSALHPGYQG
jgi:hypothetical protein